MKVREGRVRESEFYPPLGPESCLVMEHLTEFRTALRHFINFKQKQKVSRRILTDRCLIGLYRSKPV